MPAVYHCPHCGQPVAVPDHMLGQAIGCPQCQRPFQTLLPAPPASAQPIEVLSLDDEPQEEVGAFEQLDTAPRRGHYRRGTQGTPLPNRLGAVAAMAGSAITVAVNQANRRPGKGFDFTEVLIAGAIGGACAGAGYLLGKIIEWHAEAQNQQRERNGND